MKKEFTCWLDSDENHPALYGECILPRDDDAMGFALNLKPFVGKYMKITIEVEPEQPPCYWNGNPPEGKTKLIK